MNPEKLSNSSGTSRNMTGNADNRSINVGERKNNGERNNGRGRKKHDVNEKKNAREMSNVVKTSNADKRNSVDKMSNSAPGSDMKPRRKQKGKLILTLGSRSPPNPQSQRQ